MARRKPLTQEDVRSMALALPEAVEAAHMGTPDFRVRNKIFATLPPKSPGTANLKTTPAALDAMVNAEPDTYTDVWGGRWVGVRLARVSRKDMDALLTDAWRLTAPKKLSRG